MTNTQLLSLVIQKFSLTFLDPELNGIASDYFLDLGGCELFAYNVRDGTVARKPIRELLVQPRPCGSNGYGSGNGSGNGYDSGSGHGSGNGYGSGNGSGNGYGSGSGHGSGNGYGSGSGHGSGNGYVHGVVD